MTDQLLAELRKMRSTRTNLGLLAGMIALILLTLAVLSIVVPAVRNARRPPDKRASLAESILDDDLVADIEQKHQAIDALPDPRTGVVRTLDDLDLPAPGPTEKKK